jgi:hypothetical protein
MAFRGHRDSGAENRDWHYLRLGGLAIPIPGRVPVVVCCPPRSGVETVAVGKGAARSPRWRGLFIPSPNGATEAHQNRSRPYRACRMWWPHTQGCASLALGWRMLALQAKETTATTAKNTAGDGSASLTAGARATSDNGEEHGRDGSAALTAGARATSDNGEDRGQDARGTRGRDALVTEQQRRRTRPGRPCYSRAGRFGCAHRGRPCYERQQRAPASPVTTGPPSRCEPRRCPPC